MYVNIYIYIYVCMYIYIYVVVGGNFHPPTTVTATASGAICGAWPR